MLEHLLFTEKYRPKTIAECILPDRLKTPFQEYVNQNNIPNLLLSGGAGVGKTTVAKAMCEEIGCDYMIINGSDENGVDVVRYKITNYASSMSLSGGRKVIIIDEADYLSPNAQAAFRNAIEEFASNCSFNLKSTEKTQMAGQFFKRIQSILQSEEIDYDDKVIVELIKKHFPDFRRIINEIQRYSQFGKIDSGILSHIVEVSIGDIIKYIKDKDFGAIRKWVASNDIDATTFFRKLYDNLYDVLKPQSIPQAVLILADYQYKAAFVSDQEINTVACLTELMVGCEFK